MSANPNLEGPARPHHTHHEHYEHYDPTRIARLDGLYGAVEAEMARFIGSHVSGKTVLDVGCGFGSLVASLSQAGFTATGIDTLDSWVEAGRGRFPGIDLRVCPPNHFGVPDQSFDTVVLKEVIHHVVDEGDATAFLAEVRRVCKRRLLVFDPNPTWILRTARRILKHVDPICTVEQASEALTNAGFQVKTIEFSEVLAFPLSGGYVSPVRLPNATIVRSTVLGLDRLLMSALRRSGLARQICWRYLIVADLPVAGS